MNIDQQLDALKKIQPVEAPPFLLTRIKAGLNKEREILAPFSWKWVLSLSMAFILIINGLMAFQYLEKSKVNELSTVVNAMHLSNSNNLYNE